MPTFDNPSADADEAQQAMRGLAHATRSITDPRQIYSTLGALSLAASSMSQSLHQIASFHDDPGHKTGWTPGDSPGARAASYRVSWDLHRAGEILRQVADSIDHAHEAEAVMAYHREFHDSTPTASHSSSHGLGL